MVGIEWRKSDYKKPLLKNIRNYKKLEMIKSQNCYFFKLNIFFGTGKNVSPGKGTINKFWKQCILLLYRHADNTYNDNTYNDVTYKRRYL